MAMAMCDVPTVQAFFSSYAFVHNCTENRTKGFFAGLTIGLVPSIPFHAGSTSLIMVANNSANHKIFCYRSLNNLMKT
jgi:hypothetical protein